MSLNPFNLERKTILVTGASSDIGGAVAARAPLLGGALILTGRNEERLRESRASLAGKGHIYRLVNPRKRCPFSGVPDA